MHINTKHLRVAFATMLVAVFVPVCVHAASAYGVAVGMTMREYRYGQTPEVRVALADLASSTSLAHVIVQIVDENGEVPLRLEDDILVVYSNTTVRTFPLRTEEPLRAGYYSALTTVYDGRGVAVETYRTTFSVRPYVQPETVYGLVVFTALVGVALILFGRRRA